MKPAEIPKATPPANVAEARARAAAKRTPEQQARYVEVTRRALAIQEKGVPAPKGASYGDGGKVPAKRPGR